MKNGQYQDRYEAWANKWLGKRVSFIVMGQRVEGEIVEVMDNATTRHYLVAEFESNGKTVRVGASQQAFKIVK